MAFSNLEKAMAAIIGLDLVAPGVTRAGAKLALRGAVAATPVAARGLGLTNPLALGGALGIGALQTTPGEQLLAVAEERGRQDRLRVERLLQDVEFKTKEKVKRSAKKSATKFNKAVSKGIKSLKESTSYGKKGVIRNAKAAFKTATKAASARRQGKKMPKAGPARIAYKAAKGVYTDEILRRLMK
jgi:hypothetical protein